jgi:putative ABC transport system ATP-binding protein
VSTPILEFIDTVKSYGHGETEVYALRGINLALQPGELLAVMGPSGCGKSTLLHLAGGLETPSAGRVRVDGRDLGDRSAADLATLRRRDVGYVFQRLNLVPSLTAVENVMLPLELDGTG